MEERLDGGNTGGAVRVGDTVRRAAGPWTPAVHALLAHLARKGFAGSPRPLGMDGKGREVLTFLEGQTIGSALPMPPWVHAEDTLVEVARWLRGYHAAVADFVPPDGAVWRMGGRWRPGLVIGHGDPAPTNAVWRDGRLAAFIDWDMAGPMDPAWDAAFAAYSWVPLYARQVAGWMGFTDLAARLPRLRRFLAEYGWAGSTTAFLDVVRKRVQVHADGVRRLAAGGDPVFIQLAKLGIPDCIDTAVAELGELVPELGPRVPR